MIAVTGATGQLGRLVIADMLKRLHSAEVVAAVRDPSKAADLAALGVAVREADYERPETLATALEGVDRLLLISSSEVGRRAVQHRNLIEAAKEASVGFIAYTSLLHADISPLGLAEEHRLTEQVLGASGLAHTLLRNGWYTENYIGAVRGAVATGKLIGSAGDGRVSAAARADYAAAAVAVLTGEGHAGKVYELAGDDAFTYTDLAAEISRRTGRTIPYENLPEADYAAALIATGMPEGVAAMIAGMDVATAGGALFDDGRQLGALIGRPTTPIAATVKLTLEGSA